MIVLWMAPDQAQKKKKARTKNDVILEDKVQSGMFADNSQLF